MRIGVGTFKTTTRMRELVNQVLDNNRLSYGPLSKRFEADFAKLHGCSHAVLSNSGTSSLLVALQTLKELHGWQDGDEVIVPAVTFVSDVNVVLQLNLTPVLVDIEDDFYCIDPFLIEEKITNRTRAIIPTHLFGQPADMPNIGCIARENNLKIIEDSCEAAFATIDDRSISSWGDIGCHSFYIAHIITAGVGGMALTDNVDYAKKMRSLTNHGLAYSSLSKDNKSFDPMVLSRNFIFDSSGHSFRVTELESALGLAQIEEWKDIRNARQYNYQFLIDELDSLEVRGLINLPSARSRVEFTPMMLPIITQAEPKRKVMEYLTKNKIGVRDALPLTNQPAYLGLFNEDDYPMAKIMNTHGFYIGVHQGLTQEELDYMIEKVREFYK